MADDRREPGLPGSAIVKNVGDEIRQAISDGTADVRKSAKRWYLGSLVVSSVLAGVISWFWPHQSSPSWTIHHGDGFVET